MNFYYLKDKYGNKYPQPDASLNHYYSVEFLISDTRLLYQFKIWNSNSDSMFIIVKENSEILIRLKKGNVFKTKYYSTDSLRPTIDLETQIKEITRNDGGRFKGHYLVGLDILGEMCAKSRSRKLLRALDHLQRVVRVPGGVG